MMKEQREHTIRSSQQMTKLIISHIALQSLLLRLYSKQIELKQEKAAFINIFDDGVYVLHLIWNACASSRQ